MCLLVKLSYTVKKVHEFPVSSRDVTNQTPPGQEYFSYHVIIPTQGEFGSDIPAGDGKLANLFFTVYMVKNYKIHTHCNFKGIDRKFYKATFIIFVYNEIKYMDCSNIQYMCEYAS